MLVIFFFLPIISVKANSSCLLFGRDQMTFCADGEDLIGEERGNVYEVGTDDEGS